VQRLSAAVVLSLILLAPAAAVQAQPSAPAKPVSDSDAAFIEYLRRQDPAAAERFITLRNARNGALEDYKQAGQRYSAGGEALRPVSLPALQQARRRYAETSLALLDFLDERDRAVLAKLEADVERVKRSIEARTLDRAQIEKLLHGE
jgi:hypothetical protein